MNKIERQMINLEKTLKINDVFKVGIKHRL
jgi:hypothetical protein